MDDDEVRDRALVYRNLTWSWSFYGLRLHHLVFSGAATIVVLFVALMGGFNLLYAVIFFVAANVGLMILQWRKPANYIPELISYVVLPRHLTCLEDDTVTHPFPVSREEVQP